MNLEQKINPRCVKLKDAAFYVGLSVNGYRNAMLKGIFPGPIPGTNLYDLRKIDKTLDQLSGINDSNKSEQLSAYDQWVMSQNNED